MPEDNENKPLHENYFVKVGVIFLIILVTYFIASPYQNCKRDNPKVSICSIKTNW